MVTIQQLEQNLPTVLGLETERLKLIVALLVACFPLRVLLLLQLEDFLEWGSGQCGRDIVFAVKVLHVIENALAGFLPVCLDLQKHCSGIED